MPHRFPDLITADQPLSRRALPAIAVPNLPWAELGLLSLMAFLLAAA